MLQLLKIIYQIQSLRIKDYPNKEIIMHELSLAMSVAKIIERQMKQYPLSSLAAIEIEIGEQSGVDVPSFRTAIESVIRTSNWPEAKAELIIIPAEFQCLDCENKYRKDSYSPEDFYPLCPSCGSRLSLPVSGRDFRLRALRLKE